MSARLVLAYCRLSRDDERSPGTTEEKLNAQVESCRRIAASHNLPVHEVMIERASGASISKRPELLRLLHLCRTGEVSHVVCTFPDRLSRLEGRDQYEFEEALSEGSVTVVSTVGVTHYDRDREDPLVRRIVAEVAASEVRAYSRRMKERNRQKIEANQKISGKPPYGYAKDPLAPGGYAIVPDRYPTLCRILRGVLDGKSLYGLAQWLNAQGIPSPNGGKWSDIMVKRTALNPFYAGRNAIKSRQVRVGGKSRFVPLPPSDYILAPTEGAWEHPITFEEYAVIRSLFASRYAPATQKGLLTGILRCPEGGRMARDCRRRYSCMCYKTKGRENSIKRNISADKVEAHVLSEVERVIGSLKRDWLDRLNTDEKRSDLFVAHARAQRAVRETLQALEKIVTSQEAILRYSDASAYETMLSRAGVAHNEAKHEEARLASLIAMPEYEDVYPVWCDVQEFGFEWMWKKLEFDEQRRLILAFVERVQVRPKEADRHIRHRPPLVVFREWVRG